MNTDKDREAATLAAFQKYRDEHLGGVYGEWDGRDAAMFRAGYEASADRIEMLEGLLRDFVETLTKTQGCSDLGCPYKTPPNQQGTNGGCGCHYNASFGGIVRNFFDKAKALGKDATTTQEAWKSTTGETK